jgi:Ca2+-binding RTX toxin-like protein
MPGTYLDFFAAVRLQESTNNYQAVNPFGYLGAYQFGESALAELGYALKTGNYTDNANIGWTGKDGIKSTADFLNSPSVQDSAATAWFAKLWSQIRQYDIEFYDNQTLNGVHLTQSGMIAGAHLVGAGALNAFITSGGTTIARDGNGIPITTYIQQFADYTVPASFLNHHELDNALKGGSGRDILSGFGGNDTLSGGGENDSLKGNAGNDIIDGGAGYDNAQYSGPISDYKITNNHDGTWTVAHVRGSKFDGVDTIRSVEELRFSDKVTKVAVNSIISQVDFALVVDTTGSMSDSIGAVKSQMAALVDALLQNEQIDARISIVGFKDPGEVETILAFTESDVFADRKAAAIAAISSIQVSGGGDTPEGDNSGLLHSLMGNAGGYRDSAVARRIALFTDAPVKDTNLAGQVQQYASNIGVSIASSATVATGATMSVSTFAFTADASGVVPSPVEIYTILVGNDASAEASVRAIAEQNGGQFFDANTLSELQAALLEIVQAAHNTAPAITSNGGGDDAFVAANRASSLVTTVGAIDPDGDALTYAIAGGEDANAFQIDAATGELRFVRDAVGNFLSDTNRDDVYNVMVSASDGFSFDVQSVSVQLDTAANPLTLIGGNGQDFLEGQSGEDYISGGNGADTLFGRNGRDTLAGGNGADLLDGGNGDDVLSGGLGADILTGGEGADRFVFGGGDAAIDVVTDYDSSRDTIVLTNGIRRVSATLSDVGNDGILDTIILLSTGATIQLLGMDRPDLVAFSTNTMFALSAHGTYHADMFLL